MKKTFSVKLNNNGKIEELLQETYDLAHKQYNQIQGEINKIANSTKLNELDIDGKEKYGKIMANYISLQQKSIQQKFDIGKLMSDIVKYNGDLGKALDKNNAGATTLDLTKLRKIAADATSPAKKEVYATK
jgi:hypothetical protein